MTIGEYKDFESRPKKTEKLTPNIRFHIDPWKPRFQGDPDASGFLPLPPRISFHSVLENTAQSCRAGTGNPGKYWKQNPKDIPKRCTVTVSGSWLEFWESRSREEFGRHSQNLAVISRSVPCFAEKSLGGVGAVCGCYSNTDILHCSMPSFICLYLCSKSLLGLGGKPFLSLRRMWTRAE